MAVALTTRRSRLKRAAVRGFLALEHLNVHVLPRHFYSPVSDRRWLRAHPEQWRGALGLPGVEMDLAAQLAWLEDVCGAHLEEVRGFPFVDTMAARGIDFRYGLVEGQVLHCAVRALCPRVVVEVGSGASTALISDAGARNAAEGRGETRVFAIDPHAARATRALPGVEVLAAPAQTIGREVFARLGPGDLLFIDSTHVLRAGSELARLYLDVVPSLPAGVVVHVHDVYLPYAYSPWILSDLWDWQESVLLAALLTHNRHLEVTCCLSALHHAMPERLQLALPDYLPRPLEAGIDADGAGGHFPSSTWLRTR